MSPNPSASPAQEAATTPEALTCPNGPADTGHLPLHTEAVSGEAAPASSPARPTRADWGRIAIFGIPYAAFFLLGLVPASIIPQSWDLTTVNIAIDSVFLVMVLTFFWREFASTFSYLRTHPLLKIAVLFGLWFVVAVVQLVSRLAIYGINGSSELSVGGGI